MAFTFLYLVLLVLTVFAGLGLLLLVLGVRGRRIDDHPWCRKCRFDLYGLKAPATCPECGLDLSRSKAVRIGQRKKRWGMVVVGALVLLISVSGLGVNGYFQVADVNWQHQKPVWLLEYEADQTPGPTSDAALAELLRRQDLGELSADQLDGLIEAGLNHQADASRNWQKDWGVLIEKARDSKHTTDAQWQRYAEQIITDIIAFNVRPKAAIGADTFSVQRAIANTRLGNTPLVDFQYSRNNCWLHIGDHYKRRLSEGTTGLPSGGSSTNHITMTEKDWQQVPPGVHKVRFEVDTAIWEDHAHYSSNSAPLAENKVVLTQDVEFLPLGRTTAKLNTDPALRQQVEAAVTFKQAKMRQYTYHKNRGEYRLDVRIAFAPRPVDLAVEVWARHNGEETKLTTLSLAAADETTWQLGGIFKKDLGGEVIDLILRPSLEVAERSVDCFEIWGEEIEFKNVTVEKLDP